METCHMTLAVLSCTFYSLRLHFFSLFTDADSHTARPSKRLYRYVAWRYAIVWCQGDAVVKRFNWQPARSKCR